MAPLADRPGRLLFLLTDEMSSVLVRGQLGFLVNDGFDVHVATRLASGSPRAGTWDAGVNVTHLPFVREPSPLHDLRALWATVCLIRRVRPEVVNASTPKAGLLGMIAARLCRVPKRVYVVRGFRFETANGWKRGLFLRLEKLAARCATDVVFNSASLMALARSAGVVRDGRGEVIGAGSGNGIDVSRFADDVLPSRFDARLSLGVPHDGLVIGFVGRFTADKGIADLASAFTSLRPSHPTLHLLLVGQFEDGDPVTPDVRAVIDASRDVTVVPWLDSTGVAYRAMDVLVFPSYREGLPNVPLEAQLCGVPVVGYAATGTVDAVRDGETALLVPVGDTAALTETLGRVVDDDSLRRQLGDTGSTWVRTAFDQRTLWHAWSLRYRA